MNKNKRSYSTEKSCSDSNIHGDSDSDEIYGIKEQHNEHDAFMGKDYSVRKMTFGKIRYVQK